jgi:hypothetical protein
MLRMPLEQPFFERLEQPPSVPFEFLFLLGLPDIHSGQAGSSNPGDEMQAPSSRPELVFVNLESWTRALGGGLGVSTGMIAREGIRLDGVFLLRGG